MAKPLVVVDTNVFRSATDDDVARLADLATLRLSDVALAEVWARSVHEYRKHGCRRKARGLFFTPLRRWFRHLDEHQRVAPVARQAVDAVERAVAQVDEPAEVADLRERANRWVASMVYPELTDEEWLEGGEELAAYLDLVAQLIAGGAGIDEALWRAARSTRTPGLGLIRDAIAAARVRRRSEWVALGELSEQARLLELAELVTAVQLASSDGARIRHSLQAKAQSLRAAAASEQLAAANRASEYMGGPLIAMLLAFLAVVLAPALAQVLSIT